MSGQAPLSALELWLERGWVELEEGADAAAVSALLDDLLELPTEVVLEAVLDLPGIEEIYASDEELEDFLKEW